MHIGSCEVDFSDPQQAVREAQVYADDDPSMVLTGSYLPAQIRPAVVAYAVRKGRYLLITDSDGRSDWQLPALPPLPSVAGPLDEIYLTVHPSNGLWFGADIQQKKKDWMLKSGRAVAMQTIVAHLRKRLERSAPGRVHFSGRAPLWVYELACGMAAQAGIPHIAYTLPEVHIDPV
jgi:hypothetical protein